jgi:hypothetical protein
MPQTFTKDMDIPVFTFDWSLFKDEGLYPKPGRVLGPDVDKPESREQFIAKIVAYQACMAVCSAPNSEEAKLVPEIKSLVHGYTLHRDSLKPCEWVVPNRGRGKALEELCRAPLKKRRASCEPSEEDRARWKARQASLVARLEEAAQNEENEKRDWIRNRSPNGTDYSGWCREDQSQDPLDYWQARLEDIWDEPEEREMTRLEELDLACRELMPDSPPAHRATFDERDVEGYEEASSGKDYIEIDSSDGENEPEPELDAITLRARLAIAEEERRRSLGQLRAAHRSVDEQRKRMERANHNHAWKFDSACEREDRLAALLERLKERKTDYAEKCSRLASLRETLDRRVERRDYDPVREIAFAAVSGLEGLSTRGLDARGCHVIDVDDWDY